MPTAYKVLGQSNPTLLTNTTLYTVPAATQTIVSTIFMANLSSVPASVRIAIRPLGATLTNSHYIVYNKTVYEFETISITCGITMNATDVITVYSSTSNIAFSAFGSEIS